MYGSRELYASNNLGFRTPLFIDTCILKLTLAYTVMQSNPANAYTCWMSQIQASYRAC